MISVRCNAAWLTAFCLCLPALALAHVGDRIYPISYLSDDMLEQIDLKDGLVDEWYEVVGEPSMTLLDFGEVDQGSPDPSDLDFRIWLAWHDDPARFYVAFVGSDDIYKNDHDYNVDEFSVQDHMDQNDGISLVIDGDHGGGAGCEKSGCTMEAAVETRERSQRYDAIAHTPDGPKLDDSYTRFSTGGLAWNALPPYADSGGSVVGENPTISVIELYVTPFDYWAYDDIEGSMVSDLTAGQVIGFGITVNEFDPPDINWGVPWVEGTQPADHFWDMLLLKADGYLDGLLLSAGDTAVEAVSWGRIKASLR